MGDSFTEVTKTGYGKNVGKSIKGVLIGILLFLASFVVLWMNEGSVNMSKVADAAEEAPANKTDSSLNNQFVYVSGKLATTEKLGDPEFVKRGNYLSMSRSSEMYAWVEHSESETTEKRGGSTESKTTYTYSKEWTSSPADSSSFKIQEGHHNPPMKDYVKSTSFKVNTAKIGAWDVEPQKMSLPSENDIKVNEGNIIRGKRADGRRIVNGLIYIGKGSSANPKLGDVKVSFSALDNNIDATVFGLAKGDRVAKFSYSGKYKAFRDQLRRDDSMYRAFRGDRDTAIVTLAGEHKAKMWILRIVGFVLMLVGLQMILAPIHVIAKFLPFLQKVGKVVVKIIAFVVALVLSTVTILIAYIAHNIIGLIVIGAVSIGLIVFFASKGKNKKEEVTPV